MSSPPRDPLFSFLPLWNTIVNGGWFQSFRYIILILLLLLLLLDTIRERNPLNNSIESLLHFFLFAQVARSEDWKSGSLSTPLPRGGRAQLSRAPGRRAFLRLSSANEFRFSVEEGELWNLTNAFSFVPSTNRPHMYGIHIIINGGCYTGCSRWFLSARQLSTSATPVFPPLLFNLSTRNSPRSLPFDPLFVFSPLFLFISFLSLSLLKFYLNSTHRRNIRSWNIACKQPSCSREGEGASNSVDEIEKKGIRNSEVILSV